MSVLGSWLFDRAVSRLVSRLSIIDRFSCGTGEVEGVCVGLDVAAEYVIVVFCKGGDVGEKVGFVCTDCCLMGLWVDGGDTCCF